MPFVELPLNATEDRLVGTLHIEKALRAGVRQFEPGLLAAANRGVLYVDEVNLLDDHLVDLLLDAVASGINVVEREGLSFTHPARVLLVGTMNPEEGELRPQFLDRFGLCVAVERSISLPEREEIIRRHLEFEQDPQAFCQRWEAEEQLLQQHIVAARRRLPEINLPAAAIAQVAKLSQHVKAPGHRADLVMLKAGRAHAALMEKNRVDWEDIAEAARLALAHRLEGSPLDSPEQIQAKIFSALREMAGSDRPEPENTVEGTGTEDWEAMAESVQIPGCHAAGSILFEFLKKKSLKPSTMPTSA